MAEQAKETEGSKQASLTWPELRPITPKLPIRTTQK